MFLYIFDHCNDFCVVQFRDTALNRRVVIYTLRVERGSQQNLHETYISRSWLEILLDPNSVCVWPFGRGKGQSAKLAPTYGT